MAYPLSGSASPAMPVISGKLIPTLWSRKLLERFYDATVLAQISQTDYEGEIKNQGDKVTINKIPDITINAYEAGQPLVYQRPAADTIDLLIDKGFYWAFQNEDVMDAQSLLDMMGPWATNASERLKIRVDTDVLAYMVDKAEAVYNRGATAGKLSANVNLGTSASPLSVSKTTIVDAIVDMGQVMDEQSLPESGRKLVLPAWACSLIKKSELKDASISGDNTSILRNGRLGMIDRFEIFSSNLLPTTAGKTTCYATIPQATTFASQLTKTETLRAESVFGDLMRGLMVYGREVVQPNALVQAVLVKA